MTTKHLFLSATTGIAMFGFALSAEAALMPSTTPSLSTMTVGAQILARKGADDRGGASRKGRHRDDPAGHAAAGAPVPVELARRGADDKPGHVRKGRGQDDAPGHIRHGRGRDDAPGDDRGNRRGRGSDDRA